MKYFENLAILGKVGFQFECILMSELIDSFLLGEIVKKIMRKLVSQNAKDIEFCRLVYLITDIIKDHLNPFHLQSEHDSNEPQCVRVEDVNLHRVVLSRSYIT